MKRGLESEWDEEFTPFQEEREERLGKIPADLEPEEREARWIAEKNNEMEEDLIDFLSRHSSREEVIESLDWKSKDFLEVGSRRFTEQYEASLRNATKYLSQLTECFEENFWLTLDNNPPPDDPRVSPKLMESLEFIDQHLAERIRRHSPKDYGNFRSNRATAILGIWPALRDAGYTMRAAARIMARAFEIAGKESGEDSKRRESIYQTIRNAGR